MSDEPRIVRIPATEPNVHAFRLWPGFDGDDLRAVAESLDAAFDRQERVNMLLILEDMSTSDAAGGFSLKSVKTQARALSHIDRYAVVGAPDAAARMLSAFDAISGIDARAFERDDEAAAWRFVGAKRAA